MFGDYIILSFYAGFPKEMSKLKFQLWFFSLSAKLSQVHNTHVQCFDSELGVIVEEEKFLSSLQNQHTSSDTVYNTLKMNT